MPQFLQGVVGRSRVSYYVGSVKVAGWLAGLGRKGGVSGDISPWPYRVGEIHGPGRSLKALDGMWGAG